MPVAMSVRHFSHGLKLPQVPPAGVTAEGPATASANGPAHVPNAEAPFLSPVYVYLCRK